VSTRTIFLLVGVATNQPAEFFYCPICVLSVHSVPKGTTDCSIE